MSNTKAMKAAVEAAAEQMYRDACASVGQEPLAWGDVAPKLKTKWRKDARAALGQPAPMPRPDTSAEPIPREPLSPAPLGDDTGQHMTAPDGRLFGGARTTAGGMPDDWWDEETQTYKPPHPYVVLAVVRGNMTVPIKLRASDVTPDANANVGMMIDAAVNGMLTAQAKPGADGQRADKPINPQGSYGLRVNGNQVLGHGDAIRWNDFNQTWPGTDMPAMTVELVEADVRVAQAQPQAPGYAVGLGNPMVIGTSEFGGAGQILGVPGSAVGDAPPQQPDAPRGPAAPGQARV